MDELRMLADALPDAPPPSAQVMARARARLTEKRAPRWRWVLVAAITVVLVTAVTLAMSRLMPQQGPITPAYPEPPMTRGRLGLIASQVVSHSAASATLRFTPTSEDTELVVSCQNDGWRVFLPERGTTPCGAVLPLGSEQEVTVWVFPPDAPADLRSSEDAQRAAAELGERPGAWSAGVYDRPTAQTLRQVADSAARQPASVPGAYWQLTTAVIDKSGEKRTTVTWTPRDPAATTVRQNTTADGECTSSEDPKEAPALTPFDTDLALAALDDLPTDPDALRDRLESISKKSGVSVSMYAGLLVGLPLRPETRAALLRVTADLPTTKVIGYAQDALGRIGLEVEILKEVAVHQLIDPASGIVLATVPQTGEGSPQTLVDQRWTDKFVRC